MINSRFAIAFAHFGRDVDGEEMALRYQDYISQQGQTFPGAEDLLAKLVKRGYQLYGATNGVTAIQQGRLKQSAITPYFKEIFISEQLGTQKPEVAFYEKIGNLTYYDPTGEEYGFTKPYSEKTAQVIDEEINRIIEEQYQRAISILQENREKLTILAELLLEREVIFKEDLENIFGKRPHEEKETY